MAWYYMNSVGIANGGTVVSVTGGVDLSQIKSGWMFFVGSMIAEVKSGTAPDGSGNSTIILERPWEGVTAAAQTGLIAPTSGALLEALAGLENTNAFAIATHKALSDIATLDIDVTITDSAGNSHTFASMPKNARLVQELLSSREYASTESSAEGIDAAVIASTRCTAPGQNAVSAGSTDSNATGANAGVFSSTYVNVSGDRSASIASQGSATSQVVVTGNRALAAASWKGSVTANYAMMAASWTCAVSAQYAATLASYLSSVAGEKSAVIASSDSSTSVAGIEAAVIASVTCQANGPNSTVIGSQDSSATHERALVLASKASTASNSSASVISSTTCNATRTYATAIASSVSTVNGSKSAIIASDNSSTSTAGIEAVVIASGNSQANEKNTAVLASTGSSAIAGKSAVMASQDGIASGLRTTVLSSYLSTASGPYSNVIGSYASNALAATSNVIGSTYCSTGSSDRSSIISSRATSNATSNSLSMGYHAVDALPAAANQSIRLEANGGVGRFAGGTTTTGFDYAEYLENLNDEIISAGTIVTLEGGKVRKALQGEFILGAVSKTYGVLGNSPDFCWHGRYLKDEYGGYLTQSVECIHDMNEARVQDLGEHERIDNTVKITNVYVYDVRSEEVKSFDEVEKEVQEIYVVSPAKVPFREITATRTVIIKESVVKIEVVEFILIEGVETPLDGFEVIDGQVTITEVKEYDVFIRQDKIENPDYEDKPYSNRGDRPNEYTIVGLLGQLYVTVKEDITAAYVGADGLGTDDETPLRAMKMTTPFDSEKGYGVCFCYKK